jgi:sugar phosphate isomerase/epimerase
MEISRRELIAGSAALLMAGGREDARAARPAAAKGVEAMPEKDPFVYCFNTSTVMGQKVPITELIDLVAKAGYPAMEPWMGELDAYTKGGGSLKDLKKRFDDKGVRPISVIGFFDWIVDDDARRKKGLEEARRNMEAAQAIGAKFLAAPPMGATDQADLNLHRAAERYRALLELGDQFGVASQVEVWGFSKCLNHLGDAALIAVESNHPKACILADVYHLYKGGGGSVGLRLLHGDSMHCFHMNDYPADPPRDKIGDEHRVYPGDGIAPLDQILRDLRDIGYKGALSLELFSRDLWKQDPLTDAKTGLQKMKGAVHKALA